MTVACSVPPRRRAPALLAAVALYLITLGATAHSADEKADRDRLQVLFKSVQDVLLSVNAEVLRYDERFAELAREVQQPEVWRRRSLEGTELMPSLRELNQINSILRQIAAGLDSKYGQIKGFHADLKERYPSYATDIDYYFNLFDKLYGDTRQRQRILSDKLARLKRWFRDRMEERAGMVRPGPQTRPSHRRKPHLPLDGPPSVRRHFDDEPPGGLAGAQHGGPPAEDDQQDAP